ncbi:NADH-quinone oxidoreductase subunit G [Phytomonospora endophytica]|uniref:NADH-quinone oxidoreductase n=1 Tax=Phytomonospora endophytica TaxID=714109 RepID=A0A841FQI5_9ACTN|nr:NADH-quinone oxidoreductase subunit G [Phytomonospora endophytica]MBB6037093.1 NADH-quinone oxidoreductase subunit G [Phytomonospora endophytica]GIG69365.1 NADH-quinone oxidoreductase subunit G [Phytomonospora endophytica]
MTVTPEKTDTVTLTIDGIEVTVPKGTLVIRAAEQVGVEIPRFCDHPLLEPVGACRQCLVDIEGQRKPAASCTVTVADGMVVKTQNTSPVAEKAQKGIMEFLLINHPLDCPVCDKGGECPLQNQAMSTGRTETRFEEQKRTYKKALPISSQVLLDRERCVLCARCTRFSKQVAGDPFIELMERSALEQVGIYEDEPFESYFSGNTVQICPVGALTGAQYRFQARPFDLVSSPSMCEHCAAGCEQRSDHRRGKVTRRLAGDDPQVNEEWNCDKGRWAFQYVRANDRLMQPMIRDAKSGELREASWPEALRKAAEGLAAAKASKGVGVLTGGRLTVEDAYAYAKFARVALGTNDVDFRARPLSAEETEFLAHAVVGVNPGNGGVTYEQIETAPTVLLLGLEAEEECPILFLRLRKANQNNGLSAYVVAPYATRGTEKIGGTLLPTVPGGEAELIESLLGPSEVGDALRTPGAVVLVGERLASVPGALSAAAKLARTTGAKLAWVPRRAGDRGSVEAGVLPNLLPGGGLAASAEDRAHLAAYWDVENLPEREGRDTDGIIAAVSGGELSGLVVAGVETRDLADPKAAEAALIAADFVVSIELRPSAVTQRADVVFPIAPAVEKAGAYLNWEGRLRVFDAVLDSSAMADGRVLDSIAALMGAKIDTGDVRTVRGQLAGLPKAGTRAARPSVAAGSATLPGHGEAVLATWHHLLDAGSLQEGDENLAGTARTPVVRLSAATAASVGAADGQGVTVGSDAGAITLPLKVTKMPDGVVWLPTNSPGSGVNRTLGVTAGSVVSIASVGGTA